MKYPITEIFHSLQGEGLNAGRSAIFVRVGGCNFACSINIGGKTYPCDEPLHDDVAAYTLMTTQEILDEVNSMPPSEIIVITGGEPTLNNLPPLVDALHEVSWKDKIDGGMGPDICLETNGSRPIHAAFDFICIAPKPSKFGRTSANFPLPENLEKATEIRLVAGWHSKEEVQAQIDALLPQTKAQIFISPLTQFPENILIPETVKLAVDLVKANAHNKVRLSLQTHKWLCIR